MKKNIKILVIVCAAAAVLAGLMCLLIFMPSEESEDSSIEEGIAMTASTDDEGVHQVKIKTNSKGEIENNSYGTLMEYDSADISKIHIENSEGSVDIKSYTSTDDDGDETTEYALVGYEDFELQSSVTDSVASSAASIEFSKVMTLDASKTADYGLDEPRDTVTVTYTDKTKSIIYVGDDAPQSAGTYIKFGSGDAVYLVTTDSVSAFDYGLTDFISLTVNDSASDTDDSQASSIVISGTNFSDKITLKPNEDGKTSSSYIMTTPDERYANEDESSLVADGIRGLYASSVETVNPTSSQLSKLGLSKPYAKIKAVYPDVTISLLASQPDDDGSVYLMEEGGKVVYTIDSSSVSWVTTSYEALVGEYVLYPKMSALSKLTINDGSKTYTFSLSTTEETTTDDDGSETTTETTTVKCGKTEIELDDFSGFYKTLAAAEIADIKSDSTSGSPVITVTYTYSSDGTSDKVSFYKSSSSRYIAVVNGEVVGHTYRSNINSVIKQVSTVASGKSSDLSDSSETE